MAGAGLIEAYLSELRYSAGKLRDLDDVLAEVEDHLRTAAEAAERGGLSPADAESFALARFGSPQLVARVFMEEANRGGAVSTTLTRRAGLAAMLAPVLAFVGEVGNETIDRGPLHGVAVGMVLLSFGAFVLALWGLRQRHGGLGAWGRVGFWLFVVSPVLSVPFMWMAGVVFAFLLMVVVFVLGVGMLRARVLPALPVAMFTLLPLPVGLAVSIVTLVGLGSPIGLASAGLVCAAGLEWVGWILWHEPALDVRGQVQPGPLATA